MGVSKTTAFLLQELSTKGLLRGELLQLGVQRISPDAKILVKSLKSRENLKPQFQGSSSKIQFWLNLGFESVRSLDNSDFEGAEIVWDLNLPVNESLVEQFDVVFDGGTMEHVFNTSCVLANINRLLRGGGLAIHEVPSSNYVDHGFYSFSPNLFQEYYLKQGYEIVEIMLIVKKRHKSKVYQYFPKDTSSEIPENWGDRSVNVWCVARKGSNMDRSDVPQQTKYVNAWSKHGNASTGNSGLYRKIEVFRMKVRTGIRLMSKKSAILSVLLGPLLIKPKIGNSMLLRYKIKAKRNRDFV